VSFLNKLRAAVATRESLVCVGLDPELSRLPVGLPRTPDGVIAFNRAIVEATADLVCAYKPNLAFYESLGVAGHRVLVETLAVIPRELVTIGDAKRGDIGNTDRHYAAALYDDLGFDAVTASPYLGEDSLEPFLAYRDRGVFVVCRTSNPGGADFQNLSVADGDATRPLYEVVARRVREWNRHGNAALVVGATAPEELVRIRELAPDPPILIPGIGAQAGDLAAAVAAHRAEAPAVISASRSVLFASAGHDFAAAARRAASELRESIRQLGKA
jgi:orotidine-5'-phosphate decarboxylase